MIPSQMSRLSEWNPFQLDALGLVTIFGAKEMNTAIGNLAQSSVTEWLPVLGAYTVANNDIIRPEQGYVLYNVTDGIMATDVAAWFTRWLETFPLTYSATTIRLKMQSKQKPTLHRELAFSIGLTTFGFLFIMAFLTEDAWGIANVISMTVSVLSRQMIITQLRSSVDKSIMSVKDDPGPDVKVFMTLPGGKAVTILGPRMVVVSCILTGTRPTNRWLYDMTRVVCWAAFGAHAITLGMTNLFNQILSVVVLLLGTYLAASHVGECREDIGRHLCIEVDMGNPEWSRSPAYARMQMSTVEEDCMVHWSMLPRRSNVWWWDKYRQEQLLTQVASGAEEA